MQEPEREPARARAGASRVGVRIGSRVGICVDSRVAPVWAPAWDGLQGVYLSGYGTLYCKMSVFSTLGIRVYFSVILISCVCRQEYMKRLGLSRALGHMFTAYD